MRDRIVWLYLLAVLGLAAAPATANKPTGPLQLELQIEQGRVALGSSATLLLRVTPIVDMERLNVRFAVPDGFSAFGDLSIEDALSAGETGEYRLGVQLAQEGDWSLTASVTGKSNGKVFGRRSELAVIARDGRVWTGFQDLDSLRFSTARDDRDRRRLLERRSRDIPTPSRLLAAETETPKSLFGHPLPQPRNKERGHVEGKADINVRVSGVIRYVDANGAVHPIRYARVEVIDEDTLVDDVIGTGLTLADGSYSINAFGGDVGSGPDIKVRVYSEIAGGLVARVGPNTTGVYQMESSVTNDVTGSTLTKSFQTGQPVRGSTTDPLAPRIFSVLDAMLQAASQGMTLRNGNLLPQIQVVFPGGGSFYSPGPMRLTILRADGLDWDVLFHEYGHYLGDNAPTAFDNSPGGAHDGGSTIDSTGPQHAKGPGERLAWSEGWATFFGTASMHAPTVNFALTQPAIPNTGDTVYQDTEDASLNSDLEAMAGAVTGIAQGYASENSVMGMMWDLFDGVSDSASDSNARDQIGTSVKTVYDSLVTGNHDKTGKYWNYLVGTFIGDIPLLLTLAETFAMNNIAPELVAPADESVHGLDPPTFSWMANGDPSSQFELNNFDLAFSIDNFQNLQVISGLTTTSYTPTEAEWDAVVALAGGNQNATYKWIVIGHNNAVIRTPPTFGFVSNVHRFRLRSIEIELTWNKIDTDVDLHLRPPSGASSTVWNFGGDCAYYNRNPDFGVIGDPDDDPFLDRDCISTCTREVITLDKVTAPGTYKVIAHYWSSHGNGPATAMVTIRVNREVVFQSSKTLTNPDTNDVRNPETGEIWTALAVTFSSTSLAPTIDVIDTITRGGSGSTPRYWKPRK